MWAVSKKAEGTFHVGNVMLGNLICSICALVQALNGNRILQRLQLTAYLYCTMFQTRNVLATLVRYVKYSYDMLPWVLSNNISNLVSGGLTFVFKEDITRQTMTKSFIWIWKLFTSNCVKLYALSRSGIISVKATDTTLLGLCSIFLIYTKDLFMTTNKLWRTKLLS